MTVHVVPAGFKQIGLISAMPIQSIVRRANFHYPKMRPDSSLDKDRISGEKTFCDRFLCSAYEGGKRR